MWGDGDEQAGVAVNSSYRNSTVDHILYNRKDFVFRIAMVSATRGLDRYFFERKKYNNHFAGYMDGMQSFVSKIQRTIAKTWKSMVLASDAWWGGSGINYEILLSGI